MGFIPALTLFFSALLVVSDPFILFAIFSHRVSHMFLVVENGPWHLLRNHIVIFVALFSYIFLRSGADDDDVRFNQTTSEKCPIHQVIIYEIICLPMTMHHFIYFTLSFLMCGCERERYGRFSLAKDICDFYLNGATSHSPPERFVCARKGYNRTEAMDGVDEIHRSARSYVERAVY